MFQRPASVLSEHQVKLPSLALGAHAYREGLTSGKQTRGIFRPGLGPNFESSASP